MSIKTITKHEAAGRQLQTAIWLYLEGFDDVSVSVLLFSAWSILKDLLNDKPHISTRNWMCQEYANQSGDSDPKNFYAHLHTDWNFFKHAKDDPNGKLAFNNEYIGQALVFAIYDFSLMYKKTITMQVYEYWCCAKHPLPADVQPTDESLHFIEKGNELFPALHTKNEEEQRRLGLATLQRLSKRKSY